MNILFLLITSAGVNTLLMPASAKGVLTYYSRAAGDEAIFYNPATFNAQDDYRLSVFYSRIYVDMENINVALSRRFNTIDLGISIMNFDYGKIETRPEYPTEDSAGFYAAKDFSIGLCASKDISTNGRLGLKAKYIYENVYIYSGSTLALDISLAYLTNFSGITAGATNIGGVIKIANEQVNLPAKLSFGYYRNLNKFTASWDLHYLINTTKFETSLATEVKLINDLELGIAINYRDSFYPGFYLGIAHHTFSLKYGASIYPYDLGMINTIGIGFLF